VRTLRSIPPLCFPPHHLPKLSRSTSDDQPVLWLIHTQAVGTMQNAGELGYCINSSSTVDMTLIQRVAAFSYCIKTWFEPICRIAGLCIVPVCIAGHRPLIAVPTRADLQWLVLIAFTSLSVQRLYELAESVQNGYFLYRRKRGSKWLSPHLAKAILQEWLPASLGGARMGFTATNTIKSELNERSPVLRPTLGMRFQIMLRDHGLGFHVAMVAVVITVFSWSVSRSISVSASKREMWESLLTNALSPGVSWEEYFSFCTPIVYTIWPPMMPPRRDLLTQHPVKKTFRPRECFKGLRWNAWMYVLELPYVVSFLWAALACFVVFWD